MGFIYKQGVGNQALASSVSSILSTTPLKLSVVVAAVWVNGWTTNPTSMAISDNNGNSYTVTPNSPSLTTGGFNDQVWLAYLLNPSNAGTTVTATQTGATSSGFMLLVVEEFNYVGLPAYGSGIGFDIDINESDITGLGSVVNTPTITPSSSHELLYGFAAASHQITAVNSPWTSGVNQTARDRSEYILDGSSATALNFTASVNSTWSSIAAAFNVQLQFQSTEPGLVADEYQWLGGSWR